MNSSPFRLSILLIAFALLMTACGGADEGGGCEDHDDCATGQLCVFNVCRDQTAPMGDGVSLDGMNGDIMGDVPIGPVACDDGEAPLPDDLLINEVHAAPDVEDDVNCDGVLDGSKEEFVEIVNGSSKKLNLEGITLVYGVDTVKHTFTGCLNPGQGLVVYGKDITPACTGFGSNLALSADAALSLSNSGKRMALEFDGIALDEVEYPSLTSSHSSWVRNPDYVGEFMMHSDIPGGAGRYSPGQCVNGDPLSPECPPPVVIGACDSGVAPGPGEVVFNEVMAAPDTDDVNCDGTGGGDDEFIEIVNTTTKQLDLEGVELLYQSSAGPLEPELTLEGCLEPGKGLLIYNKGLPAMCDLGDTRVISASPSFTMRNTASDLALRLGPTTLDAITYDGDKAKGSWARNPDFLGQSFAFHSEIPGVDTRHSAGTCLVGGALDINCPPPEGGPGLCEGGAAPVAGDLKINEFHPAPSNGDIAHDTNCDGTASSTQDEFIEVVNVSGKKLFLNAVALDVNGSTKHTFNVCLEADRGLVVYSGGAASCTDLGDTQAFVGDSSLGLTNNPSETFVLSLIDADAAVIGTAFYDGVVGNDSWTLDPDFTGSSFVSHSSLPNIDAPHSAGKCATGGPLIVGCVAPMACNNDGTCQPGESFGNCPGDCTCGDGTCQATETNADCPADCKCGDGICDDTIGETLASCAEDCTPPPCATGSTPAAGTLVINEVHYAPDSALDDVNCDGVTSSNDEFIEIVNASTTDQLNLQDVELYYDGTLRHTFTNDACLEPGHAVLVYNRDIVLMCDSATIGSTLTFHADSFFQMTNSGPKTVELRLSGTPLDTVDYPTAPTSKPSWARGVDGDSASGFMSHSDIGAAGGARFSFGTCVDGSQFPNCP